MACMPISSCFGNGTARCRSLRFRSRMRGDEAIDRLIIEPVLAAKYLPKPDATVLDLGSGGGSPAIPMRIAAPGVTLRMVESKTRKAAFLREVVRNLDLGQTFVDAVRFEELLARPALHDAFDVVTMRAVRVDRKTVAKVQSFIRPEGSAALVRNHGSKPLRPGCATVGPCRSSPSSQAVGKPSGDPQEAQSSPVIVGVPRGTW